MTEPGDPADVMRRVVEIFSTGDLSAVDEAVSSQYVDHQGLDGAPVYGKEGFSRVVRAARRGFDELEVNIQETVVDGCQVRARLRWRGLRHTGEFVERETLECLRVEGGMAVEHWGTRL